MGFQDTLQNMFNPLGALIPTDINQNFDFNMQNAEYTTNPNLLRSMNAMSAPASGLERLGGQFNRSYQDMLDPNSSVNQRWLGNLRGQIADTSAQTNRIMNQQLAARGMGSGGMANMLGASTANRSGEQLRQGFGNVLDRSFNAAQGFGNLAVGAYGQQGNILGNQANIGAGIDSRTLQANMYNTGQQNAYQQYLRTAQYNQDVQNQNAQSSFGNSLLGLAGGIGTAALMASDKNLKKNIKLTGKSKSGINIYEFDYINKSHGEGRYSGVMAQENIDASIIKDGYLAVDYSKIDVIFRRVA